MLSSLPFSSASRAVAVGVALASAGWLAQAANVYAPDSRTLTIPVVNVPGLGSFDAQLVSTGASALPQAGSIFKLTRLVSSREPSSLPASYLFSDETVMLPAVAVRLPDGSFSYFDVKLRNISGASADTFVVDSLQDTTAGRPSGETGPKGDKGETGAQGPAGSQGLAGAVGPQGLPGKDGASGPAGLNGKDGLNGKTLLSGSADPTQSDGSDGDFYLNRVTSSLFGPKTANAWPGSGTSLKGPAGAQGAQGDTGPKGDAGASGPAGAVGPAGPKGDIGSQGLQGAKGDVGATGSPGLQGPAGSQGLQGSIGPAGPKGDSASFKAVHGCFSGAAASASGTGYTATRTNNSYSISFTALAMADTNYTLLTDARTSTGRAWAIGAVKVNNGMTLTGGWLDAAETLGQICFFAAE